MNNNKAKFNFNILLLIFIFVFIMCISVGYASLNTEFNISGEATVKHAGEIYVSNIVLKESVNATESYSPVNSVNTTNIGMNINSSNATFTYEVTITNTSSQYYYLNNINELINSEIGGAYFLYGLYVYDEFPPSSETVFEITFIIDTTPTNSQYNLSLEYIFVLGQRYKDPVLNGADPELIDGLIPIVYNESLSKWVKADVINYEWYDYSNQQWANATSVISSERQRYVDAEPGVIVEMEHMTSMMVWIPRFSYTIKEQYGTQGYGGNSVSISTPGAYDIIFHDDTIFHDGTAYYSATYPSEYYTSPGFCWGNSCDDLSTRFNSENIELSGFWMAKFEASRVGSILYSKPNMSPMINHSISQTFYYVQDLMNGMNGYNNYGYVGYVDAHLIKNTEWGVMAYLSQSAYGKYGNTNYVGVNKEIYPNNCTIYTTGIGGDNPNDPKTSDTCGINTYDTYYGMGASTTGNIYGVYDTVGGTFDRVMGVLLSNTGSFYPDSSGFTSMPERRYINVYPKLDYSVNTTPSIKGDALTDTLHFYGDRGVTSSYVNYYWLYRGGSLWSNVPSELGIFSYTTYSGVSDLNHSSRYTITMY